VKRFLSVCCLLLLNYGICNAEATRTVIEEKWRYQKTDSLVIEQRIKGAAQEYQYMTIPRTAFYDNVLPADMMEYQNLDKNSIVMIVSLVHNSWELPLNDVYITYHDEKIRLTPILSQRTEVKDETVQKVFGKYRQDCFYLLPIHLQLKRSQLTVGWVVNREGFVIARYPDLNGIPIGFIDEDKEIEKQSGNINKDFLKQFLQREFSIVVENS
jgi:hypothetical protein